MPVERNTNLDAAEKAITAAFSTGLMGVARDEVDHIDENWTNNRDALGRPWTELSPRTILDKGHGSILEDTGEMQDSLYASRNGPFSVEIGVADGKINIHEYGTETIPPRPVLQPAKTHLRSGVLKSQLVKRIAATIAALNLRATLL
jgi:phage gpG-like protein